MELLGNERKRKQLRREEGRLIKEGESVQK
jgi:hypothetical protein